MSYQKRFLEGAFGAGPMSPVDRPDPYAMLEDPMNPMNKGGAGTPSSLLYNPAYDYLQKQQAPSMPMQGPDQPQEAPLMEAPQEAKGFLQRMQETPGMGLGLMQLGAGIASGDNWGDGIGRGFSGMADTLQKQSVIEDEKAYKDAYLLAQAQRKSKTSLGSAYEVKLADGTTQRAFISTAADGTPMAQTLNGTTLDPAQIKDFKKINDTAQRLNTGDSIYVGKDSAGNNVRAFKLDAGDGTFKWQDADTGAEIKGAQGMLKYAEPDQHSPFRGRAPTWVEMTGPNGQPMDPVMQVSTEDGDVFMIGDKPVPIDDAYRAGYKPGPSSVTERTMYEKEAFKMEKGLVDAEDTQVALNRYHDTIKNMPGGIEGFWNKFSAQAKTALGQYGSLSDMEKKAYDGDAQAQAMLGKMRESVVGGGTMTEYDAVRVMEAIGGIPSGFTWNKDNAMQLTQRAMDRNKQKFNNTYGLYQTRMGKDGIRWKSSRPELWADQPAAPAATTTGDTAPKSDPLGIR